MAQSSRGTPAIDAPRSGSTIARPDLSKVWWPAHHRGNQQGRLDATARTATGVPLQTKVYGPRGRRRISSARERIQN
jgi:hypothetical protein